MKTNLKTFPESKTQGYPESAKVKNDYIRHAIAVSDWFEAFEQELRKMLWTKEAWNEVPDLEIRGWNKAIKQILGDDKS